MGIVGMGTKKDPDRHLYRDGRSGLLVFPDWWKFTVKLLQQVILQYLEPFKILLKFGQTAIKVEFHGMPIDYLCHYLGCSIDDGSAR